MGYLQGQILEGLWGASAPQARPPLLLLGLSDEKGQGYGGEDEGSRSCSRRHSSSVHKHNGYHAGARRFSINPPAISSAHTLIYRFDTSWAFITSGRASPATPGPDRRDAPAGQSRPICFTNQRRLNKNTEGARPDDLDSCSLRRKLDLRGRRSLKDS